MYSNFRCRLSSASDDVWFRVTGCVLEEACWFLASLFHKTTPIMTSNVGLQDSLDRINDRINEGRNVDLQLLNVGNIQTWNMALPGLGLVIHSSLYKMTTILHGWILKHRNLDGYERKLEVWYYWEWRIDTYCTSYTYQSLC